MKKSTVTLAALALLAGACRPESTPSQSPSPGNSPVGSGSTASGGSVDGLKLPQGFSVSVFAEGVGPARHMVARANGDVYVHLSEPRDGKCLVALRDADKDGRPEQTQSFGPGKCGTGLAVDATHLYYSNAQEVWRQPLDANLVPTAAPERIVTGLGPDGQHDARSLALDGKGGLYVNLGAPSNACQVSDRSAGSPGQDPCPILENFGGIWRFETNKKDQDKARDGKRYASGIRNAVALDWNMHQNKLFLLQHGRDQLDTLFPNLFTAAQNAELPGEEFADIAQNDNLGWPYCYSDPSRNQKLLAPEYGGNGSQVSRCNQFKQPLVSFPAHYAPNDLIFYTGTMFPTNYLNGAFIAFHGSWNRGRQQDGYNVVFVPFTEGKAGQWQVFASGFAGTTPIPSPASARYRPMGLTQLPDGSLLIVDSKQGRIWRVTHGS